MSGLEELLQAAQRARAEHPHVPLAIATLHAVEGSSYRQPGARLLVDAEGRVVAGAVSGGCLEGDIATHAAAVCANGIPKRLTYDLRDDLQTIWGFGAMCDGVAHVLLEPLGDGGWLEAACAMRADRQGGALVTVLEETPDGGTREWQHASASLRAAAAALAHAATHTAHCASGEVVMPAVATRAQATSEVATSAAASSDATSDDTADNAASTDVRWRCLVDPLAPPVSLVLVGAGRGAEAFAQIARTLGWRVTLIDHRPFVLQGLTLPEEVQRIVARADDGVQHMTTDARTAVALLTHQFAMDAEWLARVLPLPIGYVGVLGSRRRAEQLMDSLRSSGLEITPRMQRMLHAPIGLDLGGESPESIALAAIAEIEAIMHGRPGGSLRERQSPIHARTPTPHSAS